MNKLVRCPAALGRYSHRSRVPKPKVRLQDETNKHTSICKSCFFRIGSGVLHIELLQMLNSLGVQTAEHLCHRCVPFALYVN